MRTRTFIVGLATTGLLAVGLAVAAADEPTPDPACDINDANPEAARDCKIDTAFTYLDALITHDSASVRFAPDAWRMNNRQVAAQGEDEMRAGIEREPVQEHGAYQWIVDGNDAYVIYDLETDFTKNRIDGFTAPAESYIPAYIAERFRIEDGEACGPNPAPCITEVEVVYWGDPTFGDRPERPIRGDSHPGGLTCDSADPACQISVAETYIDALRGADPATALLAPDAWRLENGNNTGDSAEEIRASLDAPIMDVIVEITEEVWFVEGDQVVVSYTLYADSTGPVGLSATPDELLTPAHVVERFRIQDGLIKEIEAVFWIDAPGSKPEPRPGWS